MVQPVKQTRHFPYVLLRVAAIDAQGVEFHQLARIVFVQAAAFRLRAQAFCLGRRVGRDAQPIIQIEEHGRTLRGGGEQLGEISQSMGPDRIVLEGSQEPPVNSLAGVDIEMVHPELNHDFLKLTLAVGRAP